MTGGAVGLCGVRCSLPRCFAIMLAMRFLWIWFKALLVKAAQVPGRQPRAEHDCTRAGWLAMSSGALRVNRTTRTGPDALQLTTKDGRDSSDVLQ